jgi:hypothetical protein
MCSAIIGAVSSTSTVGSRKVSPRPVSRAGSTIALTATNQEVAGSSPAGPANLLWSIPVTWVTVHSGGIGNTFAGQPKRTNPATQARHWVAEAPLTSLLRQAETDATRVALAFPDFPVYSARLKRLQFAIEKLGLEVLLVRECGPSPFSECGPDVGSLFGKATARGGFTRTEFNSDASLPGKGIEKTHRADESLE